MTADTLAIALETLRIHNAEARESRQWQYSPDHVVPMDALYVVYDADECVGAGIGIGEGTIPPAVQQCDMPIVIWRHR